MSIIYNKPELIVMHINYHTIHNWKIKLEIVVFLVFFFFFFETGSQCVARMT
jgi:hypothetical protein